MVSTPDEEIENASKALEAARVSAQRTDQLVRKAQQAVAAARGWREENHFADKMRKMIHGAQ